MKMMKKLTISLVTITFLLSLTDCSDMSRRDRNTAVGAGAGAITGAVLTGGSLAGVVGGTAVGGVIGHVVK